jgi:hypothetical protein
MKWYITKNKKEGILLFYWSVQEQLLSPCTILLSYTMCTTKLSFLITLSFTFRQPVRLAGLG